LDHMLELDESRKLKINLHAKKSTTRDGNLSGRFLIGEESRTEGDSDITIKEGSIRTRAVGEVGLLKLKSRLCVANYSQGL
jgi:hypothetical protein